MITLISHSPGDTESFGQAWGRAADSGFVIGLIGDLGAGKTQLVKGIARGLGIAERVHSPTFALIHHYNGGRLPLFHLDLYRLHTREQILDAGLEEYFCRPQGVAVIEWAERWFPKESRVEARGSSVAFRRVSIEVLNETQRRITYEDLGA